MITPKKLLKSTTLLIALLYIYHNPTTTYAEENQNYNSLTLSINEMPEVEPINEMPEVEPINEIPEVEPINEIPEVEPINEMPEVEPINEMPEVEPINEIPEVEPINEMPEVEPIYKVHSTSRPAKYVTRAYTSDNELPYSMIIHENGYQGTIYLKSHWYGGGFYRATYTGILYKV